MKLIHILENLEIGGAEQLLLDICSNAKEHNLDIILVYSKGGILENKFIKTNIPLYKLPKSRVKYIIKLRKLLISQNIKILHLHQPYSAIYAYIAGFGLGIKYLLTHHGFYKNRKGKIQAKLISKRMNYNIAVSDSFIKLGMESLSYFKRIVFTKVYNGVSITNSSSNISLRKLLKIRETELMIGMIGNFTSINNGNIVTGRDQITVCKALKIFKDKGYEFKFVFIGRKTGNIYKDCLKYVNENYLSENIIFAGEIENAKQYIQEFDFMVYSSLGETFGLTVIESMLYRKIIIVNDFSSFIELTNKGKHAFLFKTGNETDLFKKLEAVTNMGKLERDEYTTKAIEWAQCTYSINKHISNLKLIYNTLPL